MAVANTLAYFDTLKIMNAKMPQVQAPGVGKAGSLPLELSLMAGAPLR
jgi:hypothetical protein